MGPGFCLYRAGYAFRKKTGLLKHAFPAARWDQITPGSRLHRTVDPAAERLAECHGSNGRRFFFPKGQPPLINGVDACYVIEVADQILNHQLPYFSSAAVAMGKPVNWFFNPVTNTTFANPDRHWCDIDFFDSGDIKYIWEPSRFAWAYVLSRAYSMTKNEVYAEAFFDLFESWLEANPYNIGPNFACGQECAVRLLAMVFAYYGLAGSSASTPGRQALLIKVIGVHAERIAGNIAFAISTRTNHSIIEAAGLYTAGLLFPEFKDAAKWFKCGKQTLVKEGLKQIYADGSYIQHSMNYHRLMLQGYLWCFQLGRLNEDVFPDLLITRFEKAVSFLYEMVDAESGRVPNYGANDGAIIIPLNTCDYLDYRPVLQSAGYYVYGGPLFDAGPWDEDLCWLFGNAERNDNAAQIAPPVSSRFDSGGYYTLRMADSWAMLRCHTYKDRPGHADLLHVELWFKGINILRDSGTYHYNCPPPWQDYFPSTAAHNTIVLAGQDQMPRIGRFLWGSLPRCELVDYIVADAARPGVVRGRHFSYYDSVCHAVHERTLIALQENCWVVVDDVFGAEPCTVELLWQLADVPCTLSSGRTTLKTSTGRVTLEVQCLQDLTFDIHRGTMRPVGWESLYYGHKTPAPTLCCSETMQLPCRLVTAVFCGNDGHLTLDANGGVSVTDGNVAYDILVGREVNVTKNGNVIL